jgi:hypothetical protein
MLIYYAGIKLAVVLLIRGMLFDALLALATHLKIEFCKPSSTKATPSMAIKSTAAHQTTVPR